MLCGCFPIQSCRGQVASASYLLNLALSHVSSLPETLPLHLPAVTQVGQVLSPHPLFGDTMKTVCCDRLSSPSPGLSPRTGGQGGRGWCQQQEPFLLAHFFAQEPSICPRSSTAVSEFFTLIPQKRKLMRSFHRRRMKNRRGKSNCG